MPSVFWFIGGVDPETYAKAEREGKLSEIPTNHNPKFAPVIHPTLETGVETLVAATCAWLAGSLCDTRWRPRPCWPGSSDPAARPQPGGNVRVRPQRRHGRRAEATRPVRGDRARRGGGDRRRDHPRRADRHPAADVPRLALPGRGRRRGAPDGGRTPGDQPPRSARSTRSTPQAWRCSASPARPPRWPIAWASSTP